MRLSVCTCMYMCVLFVFRFVFARVGMCILVYFVCFSCFYTVYTLLPSNTIIRITSPPSVLRFLSSSPTPSEHFPIAKKGGGASRISDREASTRVDHGPLSHFSCFSVFFFFFFGKSRCHWPPLLAPFTIPLRRAREARGWLDDRLRCNPVILERRLSALEIERRFR